MSEGPLLAARAVSRRFGDRVALHPVDLEVRPGEVLALVGPNGAGKSTLLAVLAGALAPSGGRVEVRAGTAVGWAPQRPAHYGRLSARENLEFFARVEKVPDPEQAAARLLDELGLADDRPSAVLSVGNRQRLNLAIALLGDPDVLLLDEPTAALDPGEQRRLWERAERRAEGLSAVVFATQRLEELSRIADRVAVLVDGALVFDGSLAEHEAMPVESLFA